MSQHYVGTELELFAAANNWKRYLASRLSQHIRGRVLEVGAGIGSNPKYLINPAVNEWVCLEPDRELASQIPAHVVDGVHDVRLKVLAARTSDLPDSEMFDVILYIDVLEHVEADRDELARAVSLLRPGGKLVVLAPAYDWLYSEFDRAIGHFRRYTRNSLTDVAPQAVQVVQSFYLDSAGLLASIANRLFLKQTAPSKNQVQLWDRVLVTTSRALDRLFCNAFGKSVVVVWKRT